MAKEKRDVTITTTNGEVIIHQDLPAAVADGYEDLPFTSSNVATVETKPSQPKS